MYPGRKYVKNSISFDTLRRCINKRIIMHRPRCSTVHLHDRLHRLPLGPSRVPLFLFSKFGWTTLVSRLAKEKILNTIWAAARYYLHTQAWIFSKKNSHKESDLIRFRRRIFIRRERSVCAAGKVRYREKKKKKNKRNAHAYTYGETKRKLHLFGSCIIRAPARQPIEYDNNVLPVRSLREFSLWISRYSDP